jgi:hypothetical protein
MGRKIKVKTARLPFPATGEEGLADDFFEVF